MQISAKTQYACLAALELARQHHQPHPVCLKTIAEEQGISSQFLVQILLQLKRAGIVRSTRGASGGYRLAKEPSQISLLNILVAMEGSIEEPTTVPRENRLASAFFDVWRTISEQHRQRLAEMDLESMVASVESSAADMYYI